MYFYRLIPFLAVLKRPFSSNGRAQKEIVVNILGPTFESLQNIPAKTQIYKLEPIDTKELGEIGKSIPLEDVVAVPLKEKSDKKGKVNHFKSIKRK